MKILLVEDDPKIAAFIEKGLSDLTHMVTVATEGLIACRLFAEGDFELVILDNLLPDISGAEVCQYIRNKNKNIPVLMLSALDSVKNRIDGLESGTDDYMSKPFHFDELAARIKALNRRVESAAPEIVRQAGDLEMDLFKRTVRRNGRELTLSAREFKLLEVLMRHKNRVLSRIFLAQTVWETEFDGSTNFVDVYISYLRSKIDKDQPVKLLHTVVGLGYVIRD